MPKMFENALKISSFWEVYLRKYNKRKKNEGSYVLELIISELWFFFVFFFKEEALGRMWITGNFENSVTGSFVIRRTFLKIRQNFYQCSVN